MQTPVKAYIILYPESFNTLNCIFTLYADASQLSDVPDLLWTPALTFTQDVAATRAVKAPARLRHENIAETCKLMA
jgi:hypothetical protein